MGTYRPLKDSVQKYREYIYEKLGIICAAHGLGSSTAKGGSINDWPRVFVTLEVEVG